MTESQIITQYIAVLKDQMASMAEEAMMRPKSKRFEAGEFAGRYQGMFESLDILTAILRDEYQQEVQS